MVLTFFLSIKGVTRGSWTKEDKPRSDGDVSERMGWPGRYEGDERSGDYMEVTEK